MTSYATELGATLRAWRDRLSPAAAGLPSRRARRTSGLRREELAELAGDTVAAAVVSDLRRATGRFPRNRRLTNLIQTLAKGNQHFAELWAAGAVGARREDRKIVEHPAAGPIAVDCDVMTDGDAELKIVVLTAVPDTEDEAKLRLAFGSDVPHPARG